MYTLSPSLCPPSLILTLLLTPPCLSSPPQYPSLYLIGTYAPNASEKLKNMSGKIAWNTAFEAKLRELDAVKPVVWGGDINVVATGNDISDAEKGWNKLPGWTKEEVDGFNAQLNPSSESGHKPMKDAWREVHGPDEVQYSFRESNPPSLLLPTGVSGLFQSLLDMRLLISSVSFD